MVSPKNILILGWKRCSKIPKIPHFLKDLISQISCLALVKCHLQKSTRFYAIVLIFSLFFVYSYVLKFTSASLAQQDGMEKQNQPHTISPVKAELENGVAGRQEPGTLRPL